MRNLLHVSVVLLCCGPARAQYTPEELFYVRHVHTGVVCVPTAAVPGSSHNFQFPKVPRDWDRFLATQEGLDPWLPSKVRVAPVVKPTKPVHIGSLLKTPGVSKAVADRRAARRLARENWNYGSAPDGTWYSSWWTVQYVQPWFNYFAW